MKIADLITWFEEWANPAWCESWDNCGWQVEPGVLQRSTGIGLFNSNFSSHAGSDRSPC